MDLTAALNGRELSEAILMLPRVPGCVNAIVSVSSSADTEISSTFLKDVKQTNFAGVLRSMLTVPPNAKVESARADMDANTGQINMSVSDEDGTGTMQLTWAGELPEVVIQDTVKRVEWMHRPAPIPTSSCTNLDTDSRTLHS